MYIEQVCDALLEFEPKKEINWGEAASYSLSNDHQRKQYWDQSGD